MPNLIVKYERSSGESAADAMDAVRAVIEQQKQGVAASFASDPEWTEEEGGGARWLVARLPYKFASPEQVVRLDPVVVRREPPEEEEEPEPPVEKPKRRWFKRKDS